MEDVTSYQDLKDKTKFIIYELKENNLYCVFEETEYNYKGVIVKKVAGSYTYNNPFTILKRYIGTSLDKGDVDFGKDLDEAIKWLLNR